MRALTRPKPDHTYVDSDRHYIKLPGITRKFSGFNRNPYLASFYVEGSSLLLANCHLLYGPQDSTAAKKGFYGMPSAGGLCNSPLV